MAEERHHRALTGRQSFEQGRALWPPEIEMRGPFRYLRNLKTSPKKRHLPSSSASWGPLGMADDALDAELVISPLRRQAEKLCGGMPLAGAGGVAGGKTRAGSAGRRQTTADHSFG